MTAHKTIKANRLPGHTLPHEGKSLASWGMNAGKTRCSCGKWSPKLPSDTARKRWHKAHKDEIRKAAQS